MAPNKFFTIYGVEVMLAAADHLSESTSNRFSELFSYFQTDLAPTLTTTLTPQLRSDRRAADIVIRLNTSSAQTDTAKPFWQIPILFRRGRIAYGFWSRRTVKYQSGATVKIDYENGVRTIDISALDPDQLLELTYQVFHSVVGEALDHRSLHRIHGLCFSWNGLGVLFPLNSGRGKSTLAYQLMKKAAAVKLLSDECPLFNGKFALPFPNRIGLSPENCKALNIETHSLNKFRRSLYPTKYEIPIHAEVIGSPVKIKILMVDDGDGQCPSISRGSKITGCYSLVKSMIVGIGLTQMAEFMIRGDAIIPLIRMAFSRTIAAILVLQDTEVWKFKQTKNPLENFEVISKFFANRDEA